MLTNWSRTLVGFAGAAASTVASAGEWSWPLAGDYPVEGTSGARTFVVDWLHPVSGAASDPANWTPGMAPHRLSFLSPLHLRIRAVGAPYSVEFLDNAHVHSIQVISAGATVVQYAEEVEGRNGIDLQRGRWFIPPGEAGSYHLLRGRETHIGGQMTVDQTTAVIIGYSTPPPVRAIVTGTLRVRAPRHSSSQIDSFHVWFGSLENDGVIELSAIDDGVPVVLRADTVFTNRGELRFVRGYAESERRVYGLRDNSGLIYADDVDALIWLAGTTQNPVTMVNSGDITVTESAYLLFDANNARFEHRGGTIEALGEVRFDQVPLQLLGGATSGNVVVSRSLVDFTGSSAPAVVTLEGGCEVRGSIGPGSAILLSTPPLTASATCLWSAGFENDGVIDLRGNDEHSLTSAAPIVNRGLIEVGLGRLEAPIHSDGTITAGDRAVIGRTDYDHTLAGTIELEPGARASIFGDDTTLSADVIVRPTMPTLSPVGTYLLAISGDVTFDGARLIVAESSNFTPHWGYAYNLLSFAAFDGWFDEVVLPALPDPDWEWREEWFQRRYRVKVQHIANMNDDFYIDFQDVNAVVAALGQTSGQADIDESGLVDEADVAIVLSHFGKSAFPFP